MLFLYALNSPVTKERYSTRLRYFLSKVGLTNGSIEELCRIFVEKGKQDPNWIINNIVTFVMEYKDGYDRREISSGSTIRNYIKVVKLICEMNDIGINWKRPHEAFQMEGSGLILELPALRKYEGYEYSNETSVIAAFPWSFLLLSAKNQQMNDHIIIWRLLSWIV